MKSVPLNAYPRTQSRRGGVKKLRSTGRIPAVIYGRQQTPQNLEITSKDLDNLIHHSVSENLLVDLDVKDDARPKRLALVQEIQHHALSGKVLHVDFHEVAENEKVTVMVPVETTGDATGVKNGGGILEHVLFRVKVRALPKDLPEVIVVDVSHLEIGQAIHIGDIKPAAGVEILGDKHISVIAVAAPISEAAEAAAAEAAGAGAGEVEMIKEKKEDGAEGAAPAKAGDKAAGESRRQRPLRRQGSAPRNPPKRARRKSPRRRSNFRRPTEIWPPHPARPWRICISSWGWEIPGPNMPGRGTTSVSNWWSGWRQAGGRIGRPRKSFRPRVARAEWNGRTVWLAQPQTFMNASGDAVGAMAGFFRLPLKRLLVVVDDADLPLGEIRLRKSGSSGGHHGLESIEQHVGSREFARLRLGIGRTADGRREITDYVLAPFTAAETKIVDEILAAASAQVECWLDNGIEKAMSQFNGVVKTPA